MSRDEMQLHLVTHGGYHRGAIGRIQVPCGITPPRDTLTTFLHRSEPAAAKIARHWRNNGVLSL